MHKNKMNWWIMGLAGILVIFGFIQPGTAKEDAVMATTVKDRDAIYSEIEETLGIVPTFFKMIPDSTLALEWELMKKVQMEPGPIPNKYRELIGLSVATATKCQYCTYFHKEIARLNGATEEEIEDALHYTKSTMGWSTYINGLQVDMDNFKSEVRTIVDYLQKKAGETSEEQ